MPQRKEHSCKHAIALYFEAQCSSQERVASHIAQIHEPPLQDRYSALEQISL